MVDNGYREAESKGKSMAAENKMAKGATYAPVWDGV
jgi:hypothetical protein